MLSENEINDPYFREDPGPGLKRMIAYNFNIDNDFHLWKPWRTNDGRVLPNSDSNLSKINNPFDEHNNLLLITTYFDPALAGRAFGGLGFRAPINPPIKIDQQMYIEFELYYPQSAVDKYMRFEIWSTSSGGEGYQGLVGYAGINKTQIYIRTANLDGIGKSINLDKRCGFYNGETWFNYTICAAAPVTSGTWEYMNIDLHTETGTKVKGDMLMLGNIKITRLDPAGVPVLAVSNSKHFNEVEPARNKYNAMDNFMIGVAGLNINSSDSIRSYHFELLADENRLKPECHICPPQWLKNLFPKFAFRINSEGPEWDLPTENCLNVMKSGKYKLHGHCLAWINQSPPWLRQIIPENITSMQWNSNGRFYAGGNNAVGPYQKVNKETARRIYFNHILYQMRHFMSVDSRYGSDKERGIIPFHSFDVINEEIHESRHSIIIHNNLSEWKTVLKNVSWLMAMTDDDYDDSRQHYIYLLFKFAHIAVPNLKMAEKFREGYNDSGIIPEYMKHDSNDNNGSIDAYISEKPPVLIFNDYEMGFYSKAKVAYNMIKELNTLWKTDPLYDGRNLIECMGIQGHETVSPVCASQNQTAVAMYASLIDEGLLDSVCYSELDIRQPDTAPGGLALAPSVLTRTQADAIGYQYALFFKMLEKYKNYISHVIFWSQNDPSWMNSYVLFDHHLNASQAYYGIMDPDRFIKGHSYLDKFFDGEYEKLSPDYKPKF
ncbi:MAG: endo-1,4-beta-xylanase [Treponema sp.]|jgi:GH35 family endo-1,4-beta-xylanase|nr:endo-1,4-beta-xylanase [Treponema sp.]